MNTSLSPKTSVFDLIRQHVPTAATASSAGDLLAQALQLPATEREQLFADIIALLDVSEPVTVDSDDADNTQNIETDAATQVALDWADLITAGYLEPDFLAPDGDTERLLARQKELMDTCFGGVGEETIPRKREGLAMQQLQLEQMHALRLTLCYLDETILLKHLSRCLDDPAYGYGPTGDHGRTIAQALQAQAEENNQPFAATVHRWFMLGDALRQQFHTGIPVSLRPLFDETTIDTFVPVLQKTGNQSWRLGSATTGKQRTFSGDLRDSWTDIVQTLAQWTAADNETWLTGLKQKAARLPYSLSRIAWADRLLKETVTVQRDGNMLTVHIDRLPADIAWPQFINFGTAVGVTRLSGHGFYELGWADGSRTFELHNTRRNKLPVEHTELAMALAEILAGDARPDSATPQEIEAAFLRRMKAKQAELLPAPESVPLIGADAVPVGAYRVGDITAVILKHKELAIYAAKGDTAVVLQRHMSRGELVAKPVVRGRARGTALVSTPLADIGRSAEWTRALCAWACWLVWAMG